MNRSDQDLKNLTAVSLVVAAVLLVSIPRLDREIAIWVVTVLRSSPFLRRATANIPDLLLLLVCFGTVAMWTAYFYRKRRQGEDDRTQFLRLGGTAVPVAFLVKTLLQFGFGRIQTRAWLNNRGPIDFRWWHGTGDHGGFPSGHMTVFTAFFAAVWYSFPGYRPLAAALAAILGAALVATDYHFLSDVVAGGYAGLLVTVVAHHCLSGAVWRDRDE